ncbi:Uncharacterized protein OBRU01_00267 [Operophtera brumata]|uniref:Copia protein n=1 Tax=Operophtera brumata TaxID=104452 RepID=A0A0L7LRS6_OPEBR|nr:Uncharacterized protein OBRU01_03023 [Operophtera brumata]KOB78904.1 Uncharacterized protein OBRU01_00267 [Operophtera brumata]
MTIILKAKGLHEVILKAPERDEEKDNKAQELIVTRVEESILTYLMTCKTACEMWSKLNTIFESQSECSVHLNQQKFFNLKFEPPMAKFIAVVEEIVNRLRVQKEEMPEKMVIAKILMSLPDTYKHFLSAWESVTPEKQTLQSLTARLLIEEERVLGREVSFCGAR